MRVFSNRKLNSSKLVAYICLITIVGLLLQRTSQTCSTNAAPFCKYCFGTTSNNCTACERTDFRHLVASAGLQTCECLDHYYLNSEDCSQCHLTCLNCDGPTAQDCTECQTENFRELNASGECACMSSYNEKDPIDESCHGECHYSCLTCTNTADRDCLTCERNNYRYIYEGYCVCFDGFYDDGSSDTCQQCDNQCQTCELYPENCLTCDSSVNREFSTGETADSADNNCYCSQGFYDNEDATVCLDCDYQCWECYDETSADCFDCNNSYTHRSLTNSRTVNSSYWSGAEYNDYLDLDYPLSAGICLCDSRYYDNSSDQVCQPCDYTCFECLQYYERIDDILGDVVYNINGDPDQCVECSSSDHRFLYELYDLDSSNVSPLSKVQRTCECSVEYFDDGDQECQSCDEYCFTCDSYDSDDCYSCKGSSYWTILNNVGGYSYRDYDEEETLVKGYGAGFRLQEDWTGRNSQSIMLEGLISQEGDCYSGDNIQYVLAVQNAELIKNTGIWGSYYTENQPIYIGVGSVELLTYAQTNEYNSDLISHLENNLEQLAYFKLSSSGVTYYNSGSAFDREVNSGDGTSSYLTGIDLGTTDPFIMFFQFDTDNENWPYSSQYSSLSLILDDGSYVDLLGNQKLDFDQQFIPFVAISGNSKLSLGKYVYSRDLYDFQDTFQSNNIHRELDFMGSTIGGDYYTDYCVCEYGYYDVGELECQQCHETCFDCYSGDYDECDLCDSQQDLRGYYWNGGQRYYDNVSWLRINEDFILQIEDEDEEFWNVVSDSVPEEEILKIANTACKQMFGDFGSVLNLLPYQQCPYHQNKLVSCDGSQDLLDDCDWSSGDPIQDISNTCIKVMCNITYSDSNDECPCLPGLYEDGSGDCQQCHPSCKTCYGSDYDNCETCESKNNRYYNSNLDTCECQQSTVTDSNEEAKCVACDHNCLECEDSDNLDYCTVCNASDNVLRGNKPYDAGARLVDSIIQVYDSADDDWYEVLYQSADENFADAICDRLYGTYADQFGSAECQDSNSYCAIVDCHRNYNNGGSPSDMNVRIENGVLEIYQSGDWNGVPFFDVGFELTIYETYGTADAINQITKPMQKATQDVFCHELYGEDSEGTGVQSVGCNSGVYLQTQDLVYCQPQESTFITDCIKVDDSQLGLLIGADSKYQSSDSCVQLSCRLPTPSDDDQVLSYDGNCDCQYGFYDNGQVECQECSQFCDSCTDGSSDQECDSCNYNYSHREFKNMPLRRRNLFQLGEVYYRDCECINRFYQETDPWNSTESADDFKNCFPCHYSCFTCQGSGDNECYTCTSSDHRGTYSDNTFAGGISEYPSSSDTFNYPPITTLNTDIGYCNCENRYYDEGSSECEPCDTTCLTCEGADIDECLTCFTNTNRSFLRFDGTCGCDHGYYDVNYRDKYDLDDTCSACDSTCGECYDKPFEDYSGSDTCSKCSFSVERRGFLMHETLRIDDKGLVQIFDSSDETWGNVCSDGLDLNIAQAICYQQFGINNAEPDHYGQSACVNDYDYFYTYIDDYDYATSEDNNNYPFKSVWWNGDSYDWYLNGDECSAGCFYLHCNVSADESSDSYKNIMNRRDFSGYSEGLSVNFDYYLYPYYEQDGDQYCYCISGFYEDDNGDCQQCHPTCNQCYDGGANDCSDCDEQLNRLDSADDSDDFCACDYRFSYYDVYDGTSSTTLMCQQWECDNSCQECNETTENDCIICPTNAHRLQSAEYDIGGTCECDIRYYDDETNVICQPCDNTCYKCTDSADDDCYKCSSSDHRTISSTSCPCDDRYYEDGQEQTCGTCHWSCFNCDDQGTGADDECTECNSEDHRTLDGTLDGDYCPCDDHYYDIDSTFTCGTCYSYCLTCSTTNTKDDCLTCQTGLNRTLESSDSTCPCDRHFYEVDSSLDTSDDACLECFNQCDECYDFGSNSSDCVSCNMLNQKRGSWLEDGYLTLGGPSNNILLVYLESFGTFGVFSWSDSLNELAAKYICANIYQNSDSANIQVASADCPCSESSAEQCLNLQYSFGIFSADCTDYNNCYFETEIEHLKQQQKCIELTCNAHSGYNLEDYSFDIVQDASSGDCECAPGFYYSADADVLADGVCQSCHPTCRTCDGSGIDQCLSCNTAYHRTLSDTFECQCDDRYFDANDPTLLTDEVRTPLCQPCHYSCFNCLEQTETHCTECNTLDFRGTYKKYVVTNALSGTYSDVTPGVDSNYIIRVATSTRNELHLEASTVPWFSVLTSDDVPTNTQYHLHYARKGEGYPITYYTDEYSGECPSLLHYFDDKDMTVDEEEYIAKPCHQSCLTCNGTLYNNCLTCEATTHRVFSTTLTQCVCSQKYYDNQVDAVCPSCHYTCENCWDLDTSADNPMYNCAQCNDLNDKRIFYQETINAQNSADDERTGYGQCMCRDDYGDPRIGTSPCVKCHSTCRHCKGTLDTNCAQQPFLLDDNEMHLACYTPSKQELTSTTSHAEYQATNSHEVVLETYPAYISGKCTCITHHYKLVPATDKECWKCPDDCIECTYNSGTTAVNCSSCSADQNRLGSSTSQTFYGGYAQSEQTIDTKEVGGTRNICPCLQGYFDGIFTSNSLETCQLCHHNCLECVNSSADDNCTLCDTLLHRTADPGTQSASNGLIRTKVQISLTPTKLIQKCYCDTHYYDVDQVKDCFECHYSCQNCEGSNDTASCTDCKDVSYSHRLFQSSNTIDKCLCQPFYYDDGIDVCSQCHFSCYHCDGSGSADCLDCGETVNNDFVGHAYSEALSGHRVFASNQCSCDLAGGNWVQHPSDSSEYMCVCDNRYYDTDSADHTADACTHCHHSCMTCNSTTNTGCLTCNASDKRTLSTNSCPCDDHYYDGNSTNLFNLNVCSICDYTCWNCVTTLTHCTDCVTGSNRTLQSTNKCLCNEFFYDPYSVEENGKTEDDSITCTACHFTCYHCDGSGSADCLDCGETVNNDFVGHAYSEALSGHRAFASNQCSCDLAGGNWVQHPSDSSEYMCVCDNRYYDTDSADHTADACTHCHHSCMTCNSTTSTGCLTCNASDKRHPSGNSCPCDDHYYDGNSTNLFNLNVCSICDYTCWNCVTTLTHCTSCVTGSHRTNINNVCQCDPFFYDPFAVSEANKTEDDSIICTACHFTCYSCTGTLINQCLTCAPTTQGHREINTETHRCDCEINFYDDKLHHDCKLCDVNNGLFWNGTTCKQSIDVIPFCFRIDTEKTLQYPINIPGYPIPDEEGYNTPLFDACELYAGQCGPQQIETALNSEDFITAKFFPTIGDPLPVSCTRCMMGYLLQPNYIKGSYECVWDGATCPNFPEKVAQGLVTIPKAGFCGVCPDGCSACEFGATSSVSKVKCTTCDTENNYDLKNLWDTHYFEVCYKTNGCPIATQYYGRGGNQLTIGCYNCPDGCATCFYDWDANNILCETCQADYHKLVASQYLCQLNGGVCGIGKYKVTGSSGDYCEACPCTCKTCKLSTTNVLECLTCYQSTDLIGTLNSRTFILNSNSKRCLPAVASTCTTTPKEYSECPANACKSCPIGCAACTRNWVSNFPEALCTSCDSPYKISGNVCLKECDQGYRPVIQTDGANTVQNCIACDLNCKYCQSDYNFLPPKELCYECYPQFHLLDGKCYQDTVCDEEEYKLVVPDATKLLTETCLCLTCPPSCQTCAATDYKNRNSVVQCGTCASDYTMVSTIPTTPNTAGANFLLAYPNLDPFECINDFVISTFISCEDSQYKSYDVTNDEFTCEPCPDSCSTCSLFNDQTVPIQINCLTCISTHYLQDNALGYQQCNPLPVCPVGQYAGKISATSKLMVCKPCPEFCATCGLENPNDFLSIQCLTCTNPALYAVTPSPYKRCAQLYQISGNNCATNQYAASFEYTYEEEDNSKKTFVFCMSCPLGCATCALSGFNSSGEQQLKCFTCLSTYTLTTGTCRNPCVAPCSKCIATNNKYPACSLCTAPGYNDCQFCATGYNFNAQGICTLVKPLPLEVLCSPDSYWDFVYQACRCVKLTKVYDSALAGAFKCKDQVAYFGECGSGFYTENSNCYPCANNCGACIGASLSQCKQCKEGFYLNKETSQCLSCGSDCSICASFNHCLVCKSGFFKYISNDLEAHHKSQYYGPQGKCYATCPSGTLPNVNSLYYLNQELFDVTFLESYLSTNTTVSVVTTQTIPAIALGKNHEPIFSTTGIPWVGPDASNPKPVLNGKVVNLECNPCKSYCSSCIIGAMLTDTYLAGQTTVNPNRQDCVFNTRCETSGTNKNKIVQVANGEYGQQKCVQATTGTLYITGISSPSLSVDGLQPSDKSLILTVSYAVPSTSVGTTSFWWELEQPNAGQNLPNPSTDLRIKKDHYAYYLDAAVSNGIYSPTELSDVQVLDYEIKLWQNVVRNTATLTIPASNLRQNTIYKFKCSVIYTVTSTLTTTKTYQLIYIPVRWVYNIRPLQELGLSSALIYNSPQEGLSGTVSFKFITSFVNVHKVIHSYSGTPWTLTMNLTSTVLPANIASKLNYKFSQPAVKKATTTLTPVKIQLKQSVTVSGVTSTQYFEQYRSVNALANVRLRQLPSNSRILTLDPSIEPGIGYLSEASRIFNEQSNSCNQMDYYDKVQQYTVEGTCQMQNENYDIKDEANVVTSTVSISFCCGKGTCAKGTYVNKICKCNDGNQGTFCQVKSNAQTILGKQYLDAFLTLIVENDEEIITIVDEEEQVETEIGFVSENLATYFVQYLTDMVNTQWLTREQMLVLIQKLMIQVIPKLNLSDAESLQNLVKLMESIRKATYANGFYENQKQQQDLEVKIGELISIMQGEAIKNIGENNPQFVVTSSSGKGNIGIIQYQDLTSTNTVLTGIDDETGQSLHSTLNLDSSVIPSAKNLIVQIMYQSQSSLQQYFTDQKQSLISNAYDIKVFDPLDVSTAITVTGQSSDCAVSNTFEFQMQNMPNDIAKRTECIYFDESTQKFTSNGCKIMLAEQTIQSDGTVSTKCCCNHLSMFAIAMNPSPVTPPDENIPKKTHILAPPPKKISAGIIAVAVIIPLVVIILLVLIVWYYKRQQKLKLEHNQVQPIGPGDEAKFAEKENEDDEVKEFSSPPPEAKPDKIHVVLQEGKIPQQEKPKPKPVETVEEIKDEPKVVVQQKQPEPQKQPEKIIENVSIVKSEKEEPKKQDTNLVVSANEEQMLNKFYMYDEQNPDISKLIKQKTQLKLKLKGKKGEKN